MQDTKNFKSGEFACPCCGMNNMSQVLINTLQKMRDKIGKPFKINSGSRCISRNEIDGGKPNSAHLKGFAVDISCPKGDSAFRYDIVREALNNGINRIGIGNGFIHIDIDASLPANQIWIY